MKKINLILLIFITFFFAACEADKEKVILMDSVTPNTMGAVTSPMVLTLETKNDSVKFSWTEVDYGIQVSQAYTLQVDVADNDFAAPQDLVTVNALKAGLTQGELNKVLLNLIEGGVASEVEFRVKTGINKSIDLVYSSAVTATVTPYLTSFPPIYMTGRATGAWGWDPYVYHTLRSTSPNIYETIAYFTLTDPNESTFRFFKQVGWGDSWNYPYFTGGVTPTTLLVNADDGDKNFRFLGASGYYKITVNMTTKAVDMEAVPDQVLYATGAALGGWNWTTDYIQLTWLNDGIYRATTDFTNGETFRFFAQADWNPTSYNYPWFDTVDPLFENANDGDKNFRFVGTTGSYIVTVNMLDKIVTMDTP